MKDFDIISNEHLNEIKEEMSERLSGLRRQLEDQARKEGMLVSTLDFEALLEKAKGKLLANSGITQEMWERREKALAEVRKKFVLGEDDEEELTPEEQAMQDEENTRFIKELIQEFKKEQEAIVVSNTLTK